MLKKVTYEKGNERTARSTTCFQECRMLCQLFCGYDGDSYTLTFMESELNLV
jgi:hypothetical protein